MHYLMSANLTRDSENVAESISKKELKFQLPEEKRMTVQLTNCYYCHLYNNYIVDLQLTYIKTMMSLMTSYLYALDVA